MTAVQKQFVTVMLMLSSAGAQSPAGPAIVQRVTAAREGAEVRVEITLTAPVLPSVETAVGPDRILVDLPGTVCNHSTKSVAVDALGVRRVRTAQHSTNPVITRVVIDLEREHPYTLKTRGNRIVVTVSPAQDARRHSQGAPVAATTGNLIGIFHPKRNTTPPPSLEQDNVALSTPTPPPALSGPTFEPSARDSSPVALPAPPPPVAQAQTATANPASTPSFEQNRIAAAASRANSPITASPTSPVKGAPTSVAVDTPPVTLKKDQPAALTPPEPPVPVAAAKSAATAPDAEAPPAAAAKTSTVIARSDDPSLHTVFKVKYVAEGVAYLDGGRAQGLTEGMKLEIEDSDLPAKQGDSVNTADPRVVAELDVTAVAETSTITEIHTPTRPVKVGDLAYLSSNDAEALVQQRALSATRQYPAVISFTEGDTLDEEVREEIPRPPLPSVNRARGRFGFDDIETISHGTSSVTSSDVGIVFRGDITRIGGTFWNLSGYWRGELTKASAASQQTLQSLVNRTYHLNLTYDNPNSTLVAGLGRLYLPWAPSLDTIDGGYFGKRLSKSTTVGIFGGSTPDPSSWDYNPSNAMGGTFINFEGGEYNGFHYSSTSGAGVNMVHWSINDPFLFIEDSISYKRDIAVYESAQLDSPKGNTQTPAPGPGLGRNFFTLRVNPHPKVELDFNYNYFRQIPTFNPTLAGTGLLDKYLFQGFSAGGRVELWNQFWLSTILGRSNGTGDGKTSLNEMYGITWGRVPWMKLRADLHYARFNGSFGAGSYESFSVSRQVSDRLRIEVLLGQQNFASAITANTRSRFVTGTVETTLGPHYYLQGNFTTNRGDLSYDQGMFSIGYRFDSKRKGE